eukprot:Hpha_TRINITY_DN10054_c0_g1::TRINITY_DN10054_c0_g1_i1::g.83904::m.83904
MGPKRMTRKRGKAPTEEEGAAAAAPPAAQHASETPAVPSRVAEPPEAGASPEPAPLLSPPPVVVPPAAEASKRTSTPPPPTATGSAKLMMRRVKKPSGSAAVSGAVVGPSPHDQRGRVGGMPSPGGSGPGKSGFAARDRSSSGAGASGSLLRDLQVLAEKTSTRPSAAPELGYADDKVEPTGLEMLRRGNDRDIYPVITTPQEISEYEGNDSATKEGFLWFCESSGEKRRYCEVKAGRFTHRSGRAKVEGDGFDLCSVDTIGGQNSEVDIVLAAEEGREGSNLHFVAKDGDGHPLPGVAAAWREFLRLAVEQAKEDRDLELRLRRQFGPGLSFLAEGVREEARMRRNNRLLFPGAHGIGDQAQQIKENELFLMQFPASLPLSGGMHKSSSSRSRQQQASTPPPRRPGAPEALATPGATPGGRDARSPPAPGAAKRTSSTPAVPRREEATGGTAQRPASQHSGRVLGADELTSGFQPLPAGRVGKVLVHKSGKIRMVIGGIDFEVVSAGESQYAQRLVAVFMPCPTRYKAQGFVTDPEVFEKPSFTAKRSGSIKEGQEVDLCVSKTGTGCEIVNEHFYKLKDGWGGKDGYVIRADEFGQWVPVVVDEKQAYELGEITRKVIVTPTVN